MAKPTQITGKIVKDALTKYPDMPSRTMASMLRKQAPEVFASAESARQAIRYYRGANGKSMSKNTTYHRSKADAAQCEKWGALIPDPEPNDWHWHELPADVERWLFLFDLHCPYHDKTALCKIMEHADGECDGICLGGDAMDCYQGSHFERDPRRRSLAAEVETMNRLLDVFASMRGVKRIVYKFGNHERRLISYVRRRAPELEGFPGLTLEEALRLEERGVQHIPDGHPIRHHHLAILHGHEIAGRFTSAVNPARGAFLKSVECVLIGHEHKSSSHSETTLFGRIIGSWSVGCCCDLRPEYRPLNKWNTGFCYLNAGSEWSIDNYKLINGKAKSA